jgi:hypothetical protein
VFLWDRPLSCYGDSVLLRSSQCVITLFFRRRVWFCGDDCVQCLVQARSVYYYLIFRRRVWFCGDDCVQCLVQAWSVYYYLIFRRRVWFCGDHHSDCVQCLDQAMSVYYYLIFRSRVWFCGDCHHGGHQCSSSKKIFEISSTAGPALGREVRQNFLNKKLKRPRC